MRSPSQYIKITLGVLALIVSLVVAVAILAALNAQKIVAVLQPQIEQQASKILGSKVALGKIKVSVLPRIELRIPEISISQQQEALIIEALDLTLNWLPLLWGNAEAQVTITKPQATFEKVNGSFRVVGLRRDTKEPTTHSVGPKTSATQEKVPMQPKEQDQTNGFRLKITQVHVTDGSIILKGALPDSNAPAIKLQRLNMESKVAISEEEIAVKQLQVSTMEKHLGEFKINLEHLKFTPTSQALEWDGLKITGLGSLLNTNGKLHNQSLETQILEESTLELAKLVEATQLLPDLHSQLKQYSLAGRAKPKISLQVNFEQTPILPLISGYLELENIKMLKDSREMKNSSAHLTLQHAEGKQNFDLESQLTLIDPVTLSEPLEVSIKATSGTLTPDLSAKIGLWQVSLAKSQLVGSATLDSARNLALKTTSDSVLEIGALAKSLTALKSHQIAGSICPEVELRANLNTGSLVTRGSLKIQNTEYQVPQLSLKELAGLVKFEANKQGGQVESTGLNFNLNQLPLSASLKATSSDNFTAFKVRQMTIDGLDRTLNMSANYNNSGEFDFSADSAQLGVPQLLALAKLSWLGDSVGHLGPLTTRFSGRIGPALIKSLNGSSKVEGQNIKLTGFNLVAEILKKMNTLSILSGGRARSVPEEFEEYSQAKDTSINHFSAMIHLRDSQINLQELKVVSDIFTLTGTGTVKLPTNSIDLRTDFQFTREFSNLMSARIKELERITDSNGQLRFPLRLSGTPPGLLVTPDFSTLAKLGAEKALKKEATKLLDKALSGKGETRENIKKLFNW